MSKTILVAEDNKLILETICHKLTKDGYKVIKAINGRECASFLTALNSEIGLLITDLHMPYINGHNIIELSKSKLKLETAILVLSADGAEESVLKAFELGADDYLVKPFSLTELKIRVKKLLKE